MTTGISLASIRCRMSVLCPQLSPLGLSNTAIWQEKCCVSTLPCCLSARRCWYSIAIPCKGLLVSFDLKRLHRTVMSWQSAARARLHRNNLQKRQSGCCVDGELYTASKENEADLQGMTLENALHLVKTARPQAHPYVDCWKVSPTPCILYPYSHCPHMITSVQEWQTTLDPPHHPPKISSRALVLATTKHSTLLALHFKPSVTLHLAV